MPLDKYTDKSIDRMMSKRTYDRPSQPNMFNNILNAYNYYRCNYIPNDTPEIASAQTLLAGGLFIHIPYSKLTNNLFANLHDRPGGIDTEKGFIPSNYRGIAIDDGAEAYYGMPDGSKKEQIETWVKGKEDNKDFDLIISDLGQTDNDRFIAKWTFFHNNPESLERAKRYLRTKDINAKCPIVRLVAYGQDVPEAVPPQETLDIVIQITRQIVATKDEYNLKVTGIINDYHIKVYERIIYPTDTIPNIYGEVASEILDRLHIDDPEGIHLVELRESLSRIDPLDVESPVIDLNEIPDEILAKSDKYITMLGSNGVPPPIQALSEYPLKVNKISDKYSASIGIFKRTVDSGTEDPYTEYVVGDYDYIHGRLYSHLPEDRDKIIRTYPIINPINETVNDIYTQFHVPPGKVIENVRIKLGTEMEDIAIDDGYTVSKLYHYTIYASDIEVPQTPVDPTFEGGGFSRGYVPYSSIPQFAGMSKGLNRSENALNYVSAILYPGCRPGDKQSRTNMRALMPIVSYDPIWKTTIKDGYHTFDPVKKGYPNSAMSTVDSIAELTGATVGDQQTLPPNPVSDIAQKESKSVLPQVSSTECYRELYEHFAGEPVLSATGILRPNVQSAIHLVDTTLSTLGISGIEYRKDDVNNLVHTTYEYENIIQGGDRILTDVYGDYIDKQLGPNVESSDSHPLGAAFQRAHGEYALHLGQPGGLDNFEEWDTGKYYKNDKDADQGKKYAVVNMKVQGANRTRLFKLDPAVVGVSDSVNDESITVSYYEDPPQLKGKLYLTREDVGDLSLKELRFYPDTYLSNYMKYILYYTAQYTDANDRTSTDALLLTKNKNSLFYHCNVSPFLPVPMASSPRLIITAYPGVNGELEPYVMFPQANGVTNIRGIYTIQNLLNQRELRREYTEGPQALEIFDNINASVGAQVAKVINVPGTPPAVQAEETKITVQRGLYIVKTYNANDDVATLSETMRDNVIADYNTFTEQELDVGAIFQEGTPDAEAYATQQFKDRITALNNGQPAGNLIIPMGLQAIQSNGLMSISIVHTPSGLGMQVIGSRDEQLSEDDMSVQDVVNYIDGLLENDIGPIYTAEERSVEMGNVKLLLDQFNVHNNEGPLYTLMEILLPLYQFDQKIDGNIVRNSRISAPCVKIAKNEDGSYTVTRTKEDGVRIETGDNEKTFYPLSLEGELYKWGFIIDLNKPMTVGNSSDQTKYTAMVTGKEIDIISATKLAYYTGQETYEFNSMVSKTNPIYIEEKLDSPTNEELLKLPGDNNIQKLLNWLDERYYPIQHDRQAPTKYSEYGGHVWPKYNNQYGTYIATWAVAFLTHLQLHRQLLDIDYIDIQKGEEYHYINSYMDEILKSKVLERDCYTGVIYRALNESGEPYPGGGNTTTDYVYYNSNITDEGHRFYSIPIHTLDVLAHSTWLSHEYDLNQTFNVDNSLTDYLDVGFGRREPISFSEANMEPFYFHSDGIPTYLDIVKVSPDTNDYRYRLFHTIRLRSITIGESNPAKAIMNWIGFNEYDENIEDTINNLSIDNPIIRCDPTISPDPIGDSPQQATYTFSIATIPSTVVVEDNGDRWMGVDGKKPIEIKNIDAIVNGKFFDSLKVLNVDTKEVNHESIGTLITHLLCTGPNKMGTVKSVVNKTNIPYAFQSEATVEDWWTLLFDINDKNPLPATGYQLESLGSLYPNYIIPEHIRQSASSTDIAIEKEGETVDLCIINGNDLAEPKTIKASDMKVLKKDDIKDHHAVVSKTVGAPVRMSELLKAWAFKDLSERIEDAIGGLGREEIIDTLFGALIGISDSRGAGLACADVITSLYKESCDLLSKAVIGHNTGVIQNSGNGGFEFDAEKVAWSENSSSGIGKYEGDAHDIGIDSYRDAFVRVNERTSLIDQYTRVTYNSFAGLARLTPSPDQVASDQSANIYLYNPNANLFGKKYDDLSDKLKARILRKLPKSVSISYSVNGVVKHLEFPEGSDESKIWDQMVKEVYTSQYPLSEQIALSKVMAEFIDSDDGKELFGDKDQVDEQGRTIRRGTDTITIYIFTHTDGTEYAFYTPEQAGETFEDLSSFASGMPETYTDLAGDEYTIEKVTDKLVATYQEVIQSGIKSERKQIVIDQSEMVQSGELFITFPAREVKFKEDKLIENTFRHILRKFISTAFAEGIVLAEDPEGMIDRNILPSEIAPKVNPPIFGNEYTLTEDLDYNPYDTLHIHHAIPVKSADHVVIGTREDGTVVTEEAMYGTLMSDRSVRYFMTSNYILTRLQDPNAVTVGYLGGVFNNIAVIRREALERIGITYGLTSLGERAFPSEVDDYLKVELDSAQTDEDKLSEAAGINSMYFLSGADYSAIHTFDLLRQELSDAIATIRGVFETETDRSKVMKYGLVIPKTTLDTINNIISDMEKHIMSGYLDNTLPDAFDTNMSLAYHGRFSTTNPYRVAFDVSKIIWDDLADSDNVPTYIKELGTKGVDRLKKILSIINTDTGTDHGVGSLLKQPSQTEVYKENFLDIHNPEEMELEVFNANGVYGTIGSYRLDNMFTTHTAPLYWIFYSMWAQGVLLTILQTIKLLFTKLSQYLANPSIYLLEGGTPVEEINLLDSPVELKGMYFFKTDDDKRMYPLMPISAPQSDIELTGEQLFSEPETPWETLPIGIVPYIHKMATITSPDGGITEQHSDFPKGLDRSDMIEVVGLDGLRPFFLGRQREDNALQNMLKSGWGYAPDPYNPQLMELFGVEALEELYTIYTDTGERLDKEGDVIPEDKDGAGWFTKNAMVTLLTTASLNNTVTVNDIYHDSRIHVKPDAETLLYQIKRKPYQIETEHVTRLRLIAEVPRSVRLHPPMLRKMDIYGNLIIDEATCQPDWRENDIGPDLPQGGTIPQFKERNYEHECVVQIYGDYLLPVHKAVPIFLPERAPYYGCEIPPPQFEETLLSMDRTVPQPVFPIGEQDELPINISKYNELASDIVTFQQSVDPSDTDIGQHGSALYTIAKDYSIASFLREDAINNISGSLSPGLHTVYKTDYDLYEEGTFKYASEGTNIYTQVKLPSGDYVNGHVVDMSGLNESKFNWRLYFTDYLVVKSWLIPPAVGTAPRKDDILKKRNPRYLPIETSDIAELSPSYYIPLIDEPIIVPISFDIAFNAPVGVFHTDHWILANDFWWGRDTTKNGKWRPLSQIDPPKFHDKDGLNNAEQQVPMGVWYPLMKNYTDNTNPLTGNSFLKNVWTQREMVVNETHESLATSLNYLLAYVVGITCNVSDKSIISDTIVDLINYDYVLVLSGHADGQPASRYNVAKNVTTQLTYYSTGGEEYLSTETPYFPKEYYHGTKIGTGKSSGDRRRNEEVQNVQLSIMRATHIYNVITHNDTETFLETKPRNILCSGYNSEGANFVEMCPYTYIKDIGGEYDKDENRTKAYTREFTPFTTGWINGIGCSVVSSIPDVDNTIDTIMIPKALDQFSKLAADFGGFTTESGYKVINIETSIETTNEEITSLVNGSTTFNIPIVKNIYVRAYSYNPATKYTNMVVMTCSRDGSNKLSVSVEVYARPLSVDDYTTDNEGNATETVTVESYKDWGDKIGEDDIWKGTEKPGNQKLEFSIKLDDLIIGCGSSLPQHGTGKANLLNPNPLDRFKDSTLYTRDENNNSTGSIRIFNKMQEKSVWDEPYYIGNKEPTKIYNEDLTYNRRAQVHTWIKTGDKTYTTVNHPLHANKEFSNLILSRLKINYLGVQGNVNHQHGEDINSHFSRNYHTYITVSGVAVPKTYENDKIFSVVSTRASEINSVITNDDLMKLMPYPKDSEEPVYRYTIQGSTYMNSLGEPRGAKYYENSASTLGGYSYAEALQRLYNAISKVEIPKVEVDGELVDHESRIRLLMGEGDLDDTIINIGKPEVEEVT